MPENDKYKRLKASGKKRSSFIGKAIDELELLLEELQLFMFTELSKTIGKMNVSNRKVLNDSENRILLAEAENILTKFSRGEGLRAAVKMADDFLDIKNFVFTRYELMEISRQRIAVVEKNIAYIDKIINRNLNTLVKTESVKLEIQQYIQRSILEQRDITAFREGLKEIVMGTAETEGKLVRYYQQFGNDMYGQVDALYGDETAKRLGMNYAIYAGDIIATSRQFCIERVNKVYSREEMLQWKCDPHLIGKPKGQKCDESYSYLERGRWNCRHVLDWISDSIADYLTQGEKGAKL